MSESVPEPAQVYLQLRQRILELAPGDLGLTEAGKTSQVWGVIMETGYEVGSATLVSLADGTTSLYFSTGGGMIGSGTYSPLAEASKSFIHQAESHLAEIPACSDHPLPQVGEVRFIVLTFSGKHAIAAPLETLVKGKDPLSALYLQAQNTLSQLRLSAEQKHK